jgi:hypothetical protein
MLSDDEKARITEEETLRMEARKNAIDCCFHSNRFCRKHCWLKALGAVVVITLIIGLCCHHGHHYHNTKQIEQSQ